MIRLAAAALAASLAVPVSARQVEVKMLNKGAEGMMVFEPAFVKIAPGDTVKFVAADKGHNAETFANMLPAGASGFKGAMSKDLTVTFTKPGLYGYRCLPHTGLGMVGLIEVGNAGNRDAVAAATAKLPPLARKRMTAYLAQAR